MTDTMCSIADSLTTIFDGKVNLLSCSICVDGLGSTHCEIRVGVRPGEARELEEVMFSWSLSDIRTILKEGIRQLSIILPRSTLLGQSCQLIQDKCSHS